MNKPPPPQPPIPPPIRIENRGLSAMLPAKDVAGIAIAIFIVFALVVIIVFPPGSEKQRPDATSTVPSIVPSINRENNGYEIAKGVKFYTIPGASGYGIYDFQYSGHRWLAYSAGGLIHHPDCGCKNSTE